MGGREGEREGGREGEREGRRQRGRKRREERKEGDTCSVCMTVQCMRKVKDKGLPKF